MVGARRNAKPASDMHMHAPHSAGVQRERERGGGAGRRLRAAWLAFPSHERRPGQIVVIRCPTYTIKYGLRHMLRVRNSAASVHVTCPMSRMMSWVVCKVIRVELHIAMWS